MSVSSFSDSMKKTIDEYHDSTGYSGSNSSSSHSSSRGSSTDEGYTFGVPEFPLEVIQEQLRKASSKVPLSNPLDEVEIIVYNCAVDIPSKTDEQRLKNLRAWYQIPDELNLRLPVHGEWCYNPHFGIGVYEAYFLGGFEVAFEHLC